MVTGENEQGLRKVLDLTRLISIFLLLLHFYYFCYDLFNGLGWTNALSDQFLHNIERTGLLNGLNRSKGIALAFLVISLFGGQGRKMESLKLRRPVALILPGIILYFFSQLLFRTHLSQTPLALMYIFLTTTGFIGVLTGGTLLSRLIWQGLSNEDIFNQEAQTFPQEERLLQNDYSINLPATYRLGRKTRKSWINFINPFRGLLVLGTPGSGKTYFVIRQVIAQHLSKGFSMFVYDFKSPDLTQIAHAHYLSNKHRFKNTPQFYTINFEDLSRTHRCNPLAPQTMTDITDASESARTILLGLNREWIRRQGDFFVESPINFLTAIIWYLRRYRDGEFCTLPHVIELMQTPYDKLFTVLKTQKEIEALINPFVSAYDNEVMEQLEGQVASAKISMARLSSPQLYYVLSGSDFTLDINDPKAPKVVCMGSNPQKVQTYGAVLSLYVSRLIKIVNQKGKLKSSLVFDELPTIFLNNLDSLIATARSNLVATTLGIQDFSQLKKDYGRDGAEVIMNITGNVISGQANGESAKQLSERLGKIMQERTSLSINRTDTSLSKSKQLDSAVPPSVISSLSSGEFVGVVSDNPGEPIALKGFHARVAINALDEEPKTFPYLPAIRNVDGSIVITNYLCIKKEVEEIVASELERINADPESNGQF